MNKFCVVSRHAIVRRQYSGEFIPGHTFTKEEAYDTVKRLTGEGKPGLVVCKLEAATKILTGKAKSVRIRKSYVILSEEGDALVNETGYDDCYTLFDSEEGAQKAFLEAREEEDDDKKHKTAVVCRIILVERAVIAFEEVESKEFQPT